MESVTDSSRYFVLRISDGAGKHAFIGVGFNERNEAFDFNVALSDHEKWTLRETEKADEPDEAPAASPAANLKLKVRGKECYARDLQGVDINWVQQSKLLRLEVGKC